MTNDNQRRRWRSDRHKHKKKITNKVDFSRLKTSFMMKKDTDSSADIDAEKTIIYKVNRLSKEAVNLAPIEKKTNEDASTHHEESDTDAAEIAEKNLAEAAEISRLAQAEDLAEEKPKRNWKFWQKRDPKKEKVPFKMTWKHWVLALGSTFVLALIAYTTLIYGGKIFVDKDKLIISPPTTVETKDGEILWYLYEQYRIPVDIEDIPDHVKDAFISVEDKRFYEHSGVDFRSISRAIYRDIVARGKVEGGSTLTQQLSKNLFLTNDKSWYRKIKEMMISLYLEREYTKDDILEMYLNVIYFGEGQYGVEAAANKFFNKRIEDVTLEEAALLAAMVKAPNGYSPIEHPEKAKERRNVVLRTMVENGYVSAEEAEAAQGKDIVLDVTKRTFNPAYHAFVDVAIQEAQEKHGITLEELRENRYRLVTSLDETAQTIAYEQFARGEKFPGKNIENVEGSFVMMDEANGELVSIIGGRHYKTGDLNRANRPLGQPGSTLKPLVAYAPALELDMFHPYALLPDVEQVWNDKPVRNVDYQYAGEISLYQALVQSKNTTAVWLLNEIGIDKGKKYLDKMGMPIKDNDVRIALGDLEYGVSPIQLVQAYRTFAHGGQMIEPHTITEIYNNQGQKVAEAKPKTEKVFSKQVAWTMTEMLQSVVTEGTGRAGYYPYELAGKTGTTEHPKVEGGIKDAWFVGYTPEYVTAMWMGYDNNGKEGHYLTGGSAYPTELTKMILTQIDQQKSLKQTFTQPENVQALADPVSLPVISDVKSAFTFGGFKVVKGKLTWTPAEDKRIVYRVYAYDGKEHILLDEVVGEGEYIIDKFSLFDTDAYYVVPYNPQTKQEGDKSNSVQMPF